MNAWISLFLASFFEVLWASSLKFMSVKKLKQNYFEHGLFAKLTLFSILPFITYGIFGITNVTLFSAASKIIALTIAYSVWMGLALVIQTLVDIFYFKESIYTKQLFFIFLVLIGVVGLKWNTP
jgi:quaternary ammonium compound-resistance protein SugE